MEVLKSKEKCTVSDIMLMEWIVHPNYVDEINGTNALHEFPKYKIENAEDVLKLLLVNGADVNAKTSTGETPLLTFLQHGTQVELIRILLDSGADIRCTNNDASNVLHILSTNNRFSIDTLKVLISFGADVEAKDFCGRTPLMLFVQNTCDVNSVMLLLEAGADIHCTDDCCNGVLHFFARNKENSSLDMLKLLIDHGTDINAKDMHETTPLMSFLEYGSAACLVKLLLDSGVNVNFLDQWGRNALHYCAQYGRKGCKEIIKLIIDRGAEIDARDTSETTPLMMFAQSGRDIEVVRVLLAAGADVNFTDSCFRNVLHFCAESGKENLDVVELLIDSGVSVNHRDSNDTVPILRFLENSCSVNLIRLFIRADADLTVRDGWGSNVLHYCSFCEHKSLGEILELFVNAGVDINARDRGRSTPLSHFLCQERDLDTIKMLINLGADVQCISRTGRNLLFDCQSYDATCVTLCKEIVSFFVLDHGLDINLGDETGLTPLMCLLNGKCDISIIELIINLGADVNLKDHFNNTALHCCAWNTSDVILGNVKLLIDNFIDINAKNNSGFSALGLFLINCSPLNVIHFLLESGADVKCLDNDSRTLLHMCTGYEPDPGLEIIKLLVHKGVDINAKCVAGKTPLLELVSYSNDVEMLEGFINAGADLNSVDVDLQSALHMCDFNNSIDMLEALISHKMNINAKDITNSTPLMKMVRHGSYKSIKCLLDYGADLNCRNECSKNALHLCSELVHLHYEETDILTIVKLLVEYGIDVNAKDCRGRTPIINFIEVSDFQVTFEFLISFGADITCSDIWGNTALHVACNRSLLTVADSLKTYDGMLKTVKLLALNGGDVYSQDSNGQVPLDLIVLKECLRSDLLKSIPIIDELLKHMLIKDFEICEVYFSKLPVDENDVIELKNNIMHYVTELALMKQTYIKDHVSLYDLCKESNKYKLSLYIKNSKLLSKNSTDISLFPNYRGLLNSRLGASVNRASLLSKFDSVSLINIPTDLNQEIVILNSNCLNILTKYLNETDLSNFIKASHLDLFGPLER